MTVKAQVIRLDGAAAAVVGLSYNGHQVVLFSDYKPSFKPYIKSMAVLRAIKKVHAMMKASRAPIYAVADEGEMQSPDLLARLGFEYIGESSEGDVYQWLR